MTLTRRLFLGLLPAAAVPKSWDKGVFPDWSPKFIDDILTDSPWTRPLSVSFKLRGPGAPVQTEVYLTVRWSSALPVRQAAALQQFGRESLDSPAARKILADPEDYVIEVFGFPATLVHRDIPAFEKELARSARLVTDGGQQLLPLGVRVPGIGNFVSAEFRFPRQQDLRGKSVEFSAIAADIRIRQVFKLPEMKYQGELAL